MVWMEKGCLRRKPSFTVLGIAHEVAHLLSEAAWDRKARYLL